jgi:hypothetical protein
MPSWYVDWAAPDGSIGGFVRIGAHDRGAWCWLYVVDERGTVVVRDHDVPRPRDGQILARSEGLWCELVCEVPDEHWAVNAEAFGVRLDDPTDAWHGEIGHRIPVGLELDWEAFGPVVALDDVTTHQLGRVTGEILLGDDVIDFTGFGARQSDAADTPGEIVAALTAIVDDTFALHRPSNVLGYLWSAGRIERGAFGGPGGAHGDGAGPGLPGTMWWRNPELGEYRATPLLHAPVPLTDVRDEDGLPRDRIAFALCRTSFDDGRVGHGWLRQLHLHRA